jgi:hypothetical protein
MRALNYSSQLLHSQNIGARENEFGDVRRKKRRDCWRSAYWSRLRAWLCKTTGSLLSLKNSVAPTRNMNALISTSSCLDLYLGVAARIHHMCHPLNAIQVYKPHSQGDQDPHIAYNRRVITQKLPDISHEVIDKLDCKNEKHSTLAMGDSVCNDTIELRTSTFGTASRKGRCRECERLRLHDSK